MKPFYTKAFLAGIIYLIVFVWVFMLMQNKTVYKNTLGRVSQNYERSGDWDQSVVTKVSKPYTEITEQNLRHWDADIYRCISEQLYVRKLECYGFVSGAFFPLFPLVWKLIQANTITISLLNYLLFIISIMILINTFLKTTELNKLIVFILCITLPSTVVFMIPYTEAFFMFSSVLAFVGIEKKNYKLYFAASVAVAMVRPATVFVFLSLLLIEVIVLAKNKDVGTFFKSAFAKLSPFILGYIMALTIQFLSSGSWHTYLDAQKHWSAHFGIIRTFSDWSVEGFGLTVFAIFFVAVPSLIYLGYRIFKDGWNFKQMDDLFKATDPQLAFNYISASSYIYLTGIMIFAGLVSGGNLHSFSRFILCSPAFYVTIIYLYNKLQLKSNAFLSLLFFDACLAMYFLFLSGVEYGGDRIDFGYFGSYLLVLNFLFFLFYSHLNTKVRMPLFGGLIFMNIIWNTYLFNCFLSDSWIFT